MSASLSQEEVGILADVETTSQSAPAKPKSRVPRAYNFRKPRLLSQDQIRLLRHVHTGFARDLAVFLSAQVRAIVHMRLMHVEQVHYGEFVAASHAPSALYITKVENQSHRMILEVDPRLVVYTVERLFGGSGVFLKRRREVSAIERRIMDKVIERTYHELEESWSQIQPIRLENSSFETDPEFVQIVPGGEPAVVASFEVTVADQASFVRICYPYVIIEKLMGRSGIKQWLSMTKTHVDPGLKDRFETVMRGTELDLKAELGRAKLPISDILGLAVGDVIPLHQRLHEPIKVLVGNREKFTAIFGRSGPRNALRILKTIEAILPEERHDESEAV